MKKIFFLIVLFLLPLSSLGTNRLFINEVMPDNGSVIVGKNKTCFDWIELYNSGDVPIDLKGYGLSDDKSNGFKWTFPSVSIQAKGYLLIYASGIDKVRRKALHTNFKLNKLGEDIVLTNPQGDIIDFVVSVPCAKDYAYARTIDGGRDFERTKNATPGWSNNEANGILFSHQSGFYDKNITLNLAALNGDEIYYTTDGSAPTIHSKKYAYGLKLNPKMRFPNGISTISSSLYWRHPQKHVFKAHVIKAASFSEEGKSSIIYCKTFFVDPTIHTRYKGYPVVSIMTDSLNLFDFKTGIYVGGLAEIKDRPESTGNYFLRGREWERGAHFEFFSEDGNQAFEQNVGIRIQGGKGRNLPQKSFKIYARESYGASSVYYPFFGVEGKQRRRKFLLKNVMNCRSGSMIKDECTSYICRDLNFETDVAQQVVVFINGVYWGLYSLREVFDENHIAEVYKVDKSQVNIAINGAGTLSHGATDWGLHAGTKEGLVKLHDFLRGHQLDSIENYNKVADIIDIDCLIDYYCAEIYFNNKDWPWHNSKLWQIGPNGKWRYFFYDIDAGWGYVPVSYNLLARVVRGKTRGGDSSRAYSTILFRKLLESNQFKKAFIKRMACLIQTDFSPENVIAAVQLFKKKYEHGVPEHIKRWGYPDSVDQWDRIINELIEFANERGAYIIKHMSVVFNINFDPKNYTCNS